MAAVSLFWDTKMADVTSYKTLSRDISSSSYRGFFLFMQYIKWNSSAQSASVKKAAFFRESISDKKKIQNKQVYMQKYTSNTLNA